jgi:bacterioferritin-associated ferredoxin
VYICICNAVSERDIRVAAARGARTVDALTFELGLGAGCGSCRDGAREILDECARSCSADVPEKGARTQVVKFSVTDSRLRA